MESLSVDVTDGSWETWGDPDFAARTKMRWKLIFSGQKTPTGLMSMGLAEIAPGGVLPRHHHAPGEIYHVLEGEGLVAIEGTTHRLQSGISVFIPPDVWHQVTNTGSGPLRFLFVFPTDSFDKVDYHFGN